MKQRRIFQYEFLVFILGGGILFLLLLCSQKQPMEPEKPCINDQPIEDTTRVYLRNVVGVDGTVIQVDTLTIYPPAVFTRFYPWVKDTTQIRQLAEKHHLRLRRPFSSIDHPLRAVLCVTDNRRAEYHFTPYGKEGFCNFGADSLVEYAFGLFSNGWVFPDGTIIFTFAEGTPPTRIDSLFAANGLQLLRQHTDFTSGKIWYTTLVTPRSKKNVLDLGYELQAISFVIFADVPLNIAWVEDGPVDCNE